MDNRIGGVKIETDAEWKERTKYKVTKGRRDLVAEFEWKNKDRIDKAVHLMKNEQASNYEVTRQTGLSHHVVNRVRKQRVEMVCHVV